MIVRNEKFGNLIWSDKEKAYFIANDKEIDEEVSNIIYNNEAKNTDRIRKHGV